MPRRLHLNLTIDQVRCVRELAVTAREGAEVTPDVRARLGRILRETDRAIAFDERTSAAYAERRSARALHAAVAVPSATSPESAE